MAVANAQELFNTKVPESLQKNPDAARALNAVFHFDIAGDGGGQWTVDLVSNPPTCTQGHSGTPNCGITIAHEDFMSLLANPAAGMQLYFTGKLKVSGDPMLATKLGKIFSL